MPYIEPAARPDYDTEIEKLADVIWTNHEEAGDPHAALAGDLNYVITRILLRATHTHTKPKYKKFALIKGTLRAVSDEIERRLCGPYEELASSRTPAHDISEFIEALEAMNKES